MKLLGRFTLKQVIVALILAGAVIGAAGVLGAPAAWYVMGFADDGSISGSAPIVRAELPSIGSEWTAFGGDAGGNRYSAAADITVDNVRSLRPAWTFHTGPSAGREHLRWDTAFEATPILVEDSLVVCTPFNEVIALDPGTGEQKWRYDAGVSPEQDPNNHFVCRGVSYWRDRTAAADAACAARIFMGTVDARLVAIDAKTGRPCEGFGDGGEVRVVPSVPLLAPGEYQISAAPAIVGDLVVTGSTIHDSVRVHAPSGAVHAFDARTGVPAWTFDPVPHDPNDPARATWEGDSADATGAANVWSTMSVDAERGLIFLPTSSASPDHFGGARAGDNRHANSVVALDGATGRMVWSFQTIHHDIWDYDVAAQPGLYQVWRDGQAHDVVAEVTKTGLVFVLDRETGAPFLPIEERPVPQGGVPGEWLSPTQPFPVNTPPIISNTLDPDDAFGLTVVDQFLCERAIRSLRADGLYTPPSVEGTLMYPYTGGGANWGGAAYDPARNLLVVNMSNVAQSLHLRPRPEPPIEDYVVDGHYFMQVQDSPYALNRELLASPKLGIPCTPPPWGVLAAVDLSTGEIVWRSTLGTSRDIALGGLSVKFGTPNIGGPMVTAGGLVFIGAAMDNYLRAFSVETGEELWKGRLPAGGQATPMSYEWNGRQYVVIAAGGHVEMGTRSGDSVVAFALPE